MDMPGHLCKIDVTWS